MMISTRQIKSRLSVVNIRVGDVEFDPFDGRIEIYARADNHEPARFKLEAIDDIEDIIDGARVFFHGQPFVKHDEPIREDGRAIP
jgi:hypothetical protein